MTKGITNRIKMQELVDILEPCSFDEITYDRCKELFKAYNLQGLQDVEDGLKDLFLDDYTFTLYKISDEEGRESTPRGFRINDTIGISSYVEVYIPLQEDDTRIEILAEGNIEKHNANSELWLNISFYVA